MAWLQVMGFYTADSLRYLQESFEAQPTLFC